MKKRSSILTSIILAVLSGIMIAVLAGCANIASNKLVFESPQGRVYVSIPCETTAEGVRIQTTPEVFTLTVKRYTSAPVVAAIKAQGKRESVIAEAVAKGVSEGAVKGFKGGL